MKTFFRATLGLLAVVGITVFAQSYTARMSVPELKFFSEAPGEPSFLQLLILAVSMILGILSSSVFNSLKDTTTKTVQIRRVILEAVSEKKLLIALIISPIVFNSVYVATQIMHRLRPELASEPAS